MKRVILTIGPQGAGKSTFCKQIVNECPKIDLVSRDEILIELFGTVWLSPYGDGHHRAHEIMWKKIKDLLKFDDSTIILDTWNGYPKERSDICKILRDFGVDRIEGWYFITPQQICVKWYLERENPNEEWRRESCIRTCRSNYSFYHSHEVSKNQGFNTLRIINPLQTTLFPYSYLLNLI